MVEPEVEKKNVDWYDTAWSSRYHTPNLRQPNSKDKKDDKKMECLVQIEF